MIYALNEPLQFIVHYAVVVLLLFKKNGTVMSEQLDLFCLIVLLWSIVEITLQSFLKSTQPFLFTTHSNEDEEKISFPRNITPKSEIEAGVSFPLLTRSSTITKSLMYVQQHKYDAKIYLI